MGGEVLANFPEFGGELGEFAINAGEFGVALFELLEFAASFVAERDDFGEGRAVFAFEGMDGVEAFLELLQTDGINVHLVGIMGEVGLEFAQNGNHLPVFVNEILRAGIDTLQLLQGAAEQTGLREEGGLILTEKAEGGLAEFEELGGVAGTLIILLDLLLFIGLELGGGNFVHLEAEEIELLRVGFFVDDEGGFLSFECGAAADEGGEGVAARLEIAESVENRKLAAGVQEGLMIVRAVDINEPLPERSQDSECGGGAVDELAIGAGGGEGAFEDELIVFGWFETVFFEEGFEGGAKFCDVKDGFDGATVAATANECAVGAFAEDEIERADDDGLAGAGFARDGEIACGQFQGEVGHQGKVFDA